MRFERPSRTSVKGNSTFALYASITGGVNNTKYGRSSNNIASIFLAITCASPTDFAALNSAASASYSGLLYPGVLIPPTHASPSDWKKSTI